MICVWGVFLTDINFVAIIGAKPLCCTRSHSFVRFDKKNFSARLWELSAFCLLIFFILNCFCVRNTLTRLLVVNLAILLLYSSKCLIKIFCPTLDAIKLIWKNLYLSISARRLAKVDVIIIDEISMVSSHILHLVNRIMQYCKSSNLYMGGVQRIFCGDFLQLPPISNPVTQDAGESAILSPSFAHFVPHKIILQQVSNKEPVGLCHVKCKWLLLVFCASFQYCAST